jgi:hypothetical protein
VLLFWITLKYNNKRKSLSRDTYYREDVIINFGLKDEVSKLLPRKCDNFIGSNKSANTNYCV